MPLLPPKVRVPATPALDGVNIRSIYDVDHATLLGKGGFSEVLAVRHLPTGEMRALKVMDRHILVGKKAEMVAHEREILRRTCHPSIVTLYESIQNHDKVYFALDLMNEDLFEFIVRNKKINEPLARKIMFSLLSAVNYLHEQSIVHRDIKPENVLVNVRPAGTGSLDRGDQAQQGEGDADDGAGGAAAVTNAGSCEDKTSPNGVSNTLAGVRSINDIDPAELDVEVKLADFGLAKLVMEWDVRSTPCGTSFYIAPEVIRGIEEQGARPLVTTQRLVKSVDVWSAGVVFYVLLSGRPPFRGQVKTGEERRALLKKIDVGVLFQPNYGWDGVSEEAKDLIMRMLEQDSAQRITAAECMRHPFFVRHGFPHPIPGGDPLKMMMRQRQKQQRDVQHSNRSRSSSNESAEAGTDDAPDKRFGAFIVGEGSASLRAQQQQGRRCGGSGDRPTGSSKIKRGSFLSNVKYFFTGGGHGGGGSGTATSTAKEKEEQQQLHAELEALMQDVIGADDKEGDETAYQPAAPPREQKPAKPAVMNPNAKVGPAALKR